MSVYKRTLLASMAAILGIFCLPAPVLSAQNSASPPASQDQSWSSAADSQNSMGVNPIRTGQTHTQSGNRTMDTQTLQRIGPDGRYEPYLDVEKETVKVDATTVRTVRRSYTYRDGRRQLVQTTEEEQRTLPAGEIKTVRTTSNPDANGNLQIVQKEIEDTKQTGPGAQQTTTSVFTADVNGGLSESQRTEQRETRTDSQTVQFQKNTLLKDGSGNWQTGEVRQGVIKQDGKEQTREETVSRPDSNGNLAVVERTVSHEAPRASGETQTTTETYSVDLPGMPRDGALHPVQRVTTTHSTAQDGGQSTQTRVEQPNPGSPAEGMQVTVQTTDTVQLGPGGITRQTRTIKSFNDVGNPNVVWVDMGRSDNPRPVSLTPPQGASPSGPAPATPAQTAPSLAPPQPKQ